MKKTLLSVSLIILSLSVNAAVFGQKSSVRSIRNSSKFSVKYNTVQAQSSGSGVLVKWQTESETGNLGFVVYRITAKGREIVGRNLIAGNYLKSQNAESNGGSYSIFDKAGDVSSQYVIESIGVSGQKQASQTVASESLTSSSDADAAAFESAKVSADRVTNYDTYSSGLKSANPAADLTDINTQRAVAAQPGVKIGIKQDGFYRVTKAQLQAAGFNLTPSSANWQLYLNGIEQSIIVGGGGSYFDFYGKTIDTSESNTQIYFLINGGTAGKRIASRLVRRMNANIAANSYYQTFTRKERSIYVSGILNGEAENFFGSFILSPANPVPADDPADDKFTLPNVDVNSAANAVLELNAQGLSTGDHQIDLQINGHALSSITGSGNVALSGTYTIPAAYLVDGLNRLKLTEPAGFGVSLVSSIRVSYSRKYTAVQNQLEFNTQNYKTATIGNFSSSNIRVFDVTNPDSPTLANNLSVVQSGSTYGVVLPASRTRKFYGVEDSGLLTAASITANTPSTLATTAHNANLVIISHGNFITQANAWAAYRAGQGTSVEVVNVEDVYDEFNYGVFSSNSIRDFLQYAKSNWQTPPQYVLFIGDATYDPKNYEGRGNNDFIPTKIIDTIYLETGSDEALADFNNDGLAEIAVGRIPARTGQVVTNALAKVQTFEAGVANAQSRGALFISDEPNGYDFQGVSTRLSQRLPASMAKSFVVRNETDATNKTITQLNSGKYLVNYSGHGNAGAWSTGNFFLSSNAASLNNGNNLFVFTSLSCLNGYFIDTGINSGSANPDGDALSEFMLKNTNGGAVAVWSSTGLTTPDIQEIMGTRFYDDITAGSITRLGDLINDAKTTIPGGRDVRLSWNLLGDPMTKMK